MFDIHFVQQLVNGLSIGLVYALIAIGFTLIFGVLNVVNFAHGEVYTIGAFAGLFLIAAAAPPLVAVLAAVLAVGAFTGLGLERLAFKPFRRFRGLGGDCFLGKLARRDGGGTEERNPDQQRGRCAEVANAQ